MDVRTKSVAGGIAVSWSAVAGAEAYAVYRGGNAYAHIGAERVAVVKDELVHVDYPAGRSGLYSYFVRPVFAGGVLGQPSGVEMGRLLASDSLAGADISGKILRNHKTTLL